MASFRFIKDAEGWYIDLKGSPFTRKQLAMVRGADTFLDILAAGKSEVVISASTSFIPGYSELVRKKIRTFGTGGADYLVESYGGKRYDHAVFLCPVTLWIFLRYPKVIYFKLA